MAGKPEAKSKELAEVHSSTAAGDSELVDADQNSSAGPSETQVFSVSQEFSGPYPPPGILAAYKEIDPEFVVAILKTAEKEQEHRHDMDKEAMRLTEVSVQQGSRGQIFGFVISMTTILGGIGLIASGYETTGLVSIVSALVLLAGVFVTGKISDAVENWNEKK